jgi:hypothetical protein
VKIWIAEALLAGLVGGAILAITGLGEIISVAMGLIP